MNVTNTVERSRNVNEVRGMNRQAGGKVTISLYLVLILSGAGLLSGATSLWLSAHRMIEVSCRH